MKCQGPDCTNDARERVGNRGPQPKYCLSCAVRNQREMQQRSKSKASRDRIVRRLTAAGVCPECVGIVADLRVRT